MMRRRYTARHVGRVRERLADMLIAAFAEIGEQCGCDPSKLWPQQGRWRSDFRMDVCRWEGQVELHRNGKWKTAQVMSWFTMTECVRFGLTVERDGFFFEVFAKDDLKSFRKRAA